MSFFSTIMSIFQDSAGDDVADGDLELNSDQLALLGYSHVCLGIPINYRP